MKKEYMTPEMDVVEMDYENRLLCESNCSEPETTTPFTDKTTTGLLG